MSVEIEPLKPADRPAWEVLARGYKAFYNTPTSDAEYDTAWNRLLAHDGVFGLAGLGRWATGRHRALPVPHVGLGAEQLLPARPVHVAGGARPRRGACADRRGGAQARERKAARYYWLTQEHNAVARVLYNKVGKYQGFIRYDYPL